VAEGTKKDSNHVHGYSLILIKEMGRTGGGWWVTADIEVSSNDSGAHT
jgi:hypothetical protein